MGRFIEQAIERAGLGGLLRGEHVDVPADVDLLTLGAVADELRSRNAGDVVRIHPTESAGVHWVHGKDLALLREVAMARIAGHARVGVDWAETGLELAQVALGFGATDLTGPITKKSGLIILETDLKKVKGKGMVAASALKRREIAALVHNAGRVCELTDEDVAAASQEVEGVQAHA